MYTKPRPIIPRYRAISGLLSMLIVFALLCGGAGYLAQVTGKLTPLEKILGFSSQPSMTTAYSHPLTVPSTLQTPGPGNTIITSVGLGASVDKTSNLISIYVNQFTVDQTIYITCSLNTPTAGMVTVKWYTNGNYDRSSMKSVPANTLGTVDFTIGFAIPTEGKAEVYWNNQLAETLLFVVEPSAQ